MDTRAMRSGDQEHPDVLAVQRRKPHLPVEAIALRAEAGAASVLKMAYAAWTKGSAALLLAIRALARGEGVEDRERPGPVLRREQRPDPVQPGHALVIPRAHHPNLFETPPEVVAATARDLVAPSLGDLVEGAAPAGGAPSGTSSSTVSSSIKARSTAASSTPRAPTATRRVRTLG